MAARINPFARGSVSLQIGGAKENRTSAPSAETRLFLREREIRFIALGSALKGERLDVKTQDDLILFLTPVNGAEKTLSVLKVISIPKRYFVITPAWQNGNLKIQGERIILDGPGEHKTPVDVAGKPQETKQGEDPAGNARSVGLKQMEFIIKFPLGALRPLPMLTVNQT